MILTLDAKCIGLFVTYIITFASSTSLINSILRLKKLIFMTEKPRKDAAIYYYESNHTFFEVTNQNAVLYNIIMHYILCLC